jgi:hypothetical protein
MSPEQARGEHKKIDGRSDVYSLGATLYMLLARRPPFTSTNLATLLLEVLDKTPPPLSRFNKEISPELQMLVERAMAKDPGAALPDDGGVRRGAGPDDPRGALRGPLRDGEGGGAALGPAAGVAAVVGAARWFGIPILLRGRPKPAPSTGPDAEMLGGRRGALRTLEDQSLARRSAASGRGAGARAARGGAAEEAGRAAREGGAGARALRAGRARRGREGAGGARGSAGRRITGCP